MNLTSKKDIKHILEKYNIKPSKKFGQNFLVDEEILQKIARTANIGPNDIVLEIGPGIGTLTEELAKKAKRVIAVEKDERMVEILRETLKKYKNIEIVKGDVLKIPITNKQYLADEYKLVANLPFYVAAPIIRKFLEEENPPKEMVLMVQKEVGQRICAKPPEMSLLAVSVQFYGRPEIAFYVGKGNFLPVPKVDSAVIKIVPSNNYLRIVGPDVFFKVAKAGFSQPRKQLANNLSKGLKLDKEKASRWLLKNNIDFTRRAESLKMEEWVELAKNSSL